MKKYNLKRHISISIILFFVLIILRFFLVKIPLEYGYGDVSLGTLFSSLYGVYLIFVSCLYFTEVFNKWRNNLSWKNELFKAFLLLLLFYVFITLLVTFGDVRTILDGDSYLMVLVFVSPSIVFFVSIYNVFLSIKSFIIAKKEKNSYGFGILLLVISIALAVLSFLAAWFAISYLIQGGFII